MKVSQAKQTVGSTWLHIVQQQVESLRFGVVQIVVHEGGVVQIERTEKFRLPTPASAEPSSNFSPNQNTGGPQPHE